MNCTKKERMSLIFVCLAWKWKQCEYITKTNHLSPKNIIYWHAIPLHLNPTQSTRSILSVRNVPKVSSDIQLSFQSFIENKGHPCRGRFLVAAATLHPGWCRRKTMMGGGGLLETTGRRKNRLANRAGDPNLTLPCPQQASTSLIPQRYFFYISIKPLTAPLFLSPEMFFFFSWAMTLQYNCVS